MRAVSALFAIFGLDFLTKKWAEEHLPLYGKKEIVKNHLYFRHIKNSGIAYNRFSGKANDILLFTGGLLAYYSSLFLRSLRGAVSSKYTMPLALLLGGGFGNFMERLRKGKVTDFVFIPIEGKNAPIFNLADVFICIGALWLTIISCGENDKK